MDYVNCPKCGKLFSRGLKPICPECEKAEEDLFQNVRQYLSDNPGAKMEDLSRETGVSLKKIMRYLREGRLEVVPSLGIDLRCENCGKPIKTGRFCPNCVDALESDLSGLFTKPKPEKSEPAGARMHTSDYRRKNN